MVDLWKYFARLLGEFIGRPGTKAWDFCLETRMVHNLVIEIKIYQAVLYFCVHFEKREMHF